MALITSGSSSTEEEKLEVVIPPPCRILTEKEITKLRHLELYQAALDGDWKKAEKIYEAHRKDITARISKDRDTALHIAVAAERTSFVKGLMEKINCENLDILGMRNDNGNTPFCLAAACGSVKLAKLMMVKKHELVGSTAPAASGKIELYNVTDESGKLVDVKIRTYTNLALIPGSNNMLPLEIAALFGHKDMVKFLYEPNSVKSIDDNHRLQFLINLISAGFYDVALDLVKSHRHLVTARAANKETALHALARVSIANQQGFWKRCFNLCTIMFRQKNQDLEAAKLVKYLWKQVVLLDDSNISKLIGIPINRKLVFVAAAEGNIGFLAILIREYPDLLFKVDGNNYTIFHYAVRNRHKDIFELIYKIGSSKDLITPYKDKEGNNILHLASMLAPSHRLNIVSGAALQLQRELSWFKEVHKIMHPLDAIKENNNGDTPRALFTKEHRLLKESGEKWMKGTAKSCMIMATLIATVVFAAAFTVPGNTKQDTGTPNFLLKGSFTIFAISDAISLVFSSCSIVIFLSILTCRYAEEDFIWWLPMKLFFGLLTLCISVAAMMAVFCATFFIVFNRGKRWCAFFVVGISPVPVFLFIVLHIRLIIDLGLSTIYLLSSSSTINKLFPLKRRKQRNLRGSKWV